MDPILSWNATALQANRVSHTVPGGEQRGPVLSSRALAIVHLAMYDAYASVVNDPVHLPLYLTPGLPPPPGASPDSAVAGAAHHALRTLYPSQAAALDLVLADGMFDTSSVAFGVSVAAAILADRDQDPGADSALYVPPTTPRTAHRPDPTNPGQGYHAPFYGARSKGFAIGHRHELNAPPSGAEYLKALRQVRAKGIHPTLMGALPEDLRAHRRTNDETIIGIYYAYDGAKELGTPPRLYNQMIRELPRVKDNSVRDNARLFALVNVAMADAGILVWDQKYIHNLWRPVIGIREHDHSLGPRGTPGSNPTDDCDISWLPLGAPHSNTVSGDSFTPANPSYPSGHAAFGAAAFQMVRLFYGQGAHEPDNLFKDAFFVSDELNGTTTDSSGTVRPRHVRKFPHGLWQAIEENARSPIYLGIHWIFDCFAVDTHNHAQLSRNVGGVPLGLRVAEDIFGGGRAKGLKKSTVPPRS